MDDLPRIIQNIKTYADSSSHLERERSSAPVSGSSQRDYETQLDEAIGRLRDQVKQHEEALQKLRGSHDTPATIAPSSHPAERLRQIQTIKSAYESLTQSPPSFPPKDSPLPALLALRDTGNTIKTSKASIKAQIARLGDLSETLEKENAELRDARLMQRALEERIRALRTDDTQPLTPAAMAENLVLEQQKLGKDLDKDTRKLTKALHKFVDYDLSALLAAEELGGPNVGEVDEVDDGTLEAGYTKQGRPKKPKDNRSTGKEDGQSKKDIAAAEMHTLLDELLEASFHSSGSTSYVKLDRESAAARFLIRAKVAQFHPRDAQKIRLVEFGREIDD